MCHYHLYTNIPNTDSFHVHPFTFSIFHSFVCNVNKNRKGIMPTAKINMNKLESHTQLDKKNKKYESTAASANLEWNFLIISSSDDLHMQVVHLYIFRGINNCPFPIFNHEFGLYINCVPAFSSTICHLLVLNK